MLGEAIDSYYGDFSLSPDGDKIAFTGLKDEPGYDTGSSSYLFILNLKCHVLFACYYYLLYCGCGLRCIGHCKYH